MNAAIRAVVRAGISSGADMVGARRGYTDVMVGEIAGKVTQTPLIEAGSGARELDHSLIALVRKLAI